MKKRIHAGYTRWQWRLIRGCLVGKLSRLPETDEPVPRHPEEILSDLRRQLEQMWRRLPRGFR